MFNLKTIFNDAGEQEIRTVVLYAHTDNFVYTDAKHKTKVGAAALLEMCMKGMALITTDGKAFNRPIAFKNESTHVSVTVETGTGATANIKAYKSENFSA